MDMKKCITDTPQHVEEIQISLLRKQSIAQKFTMVRSLSETAIALSKRAIARKNKDFDDIKINLMFIRLNYGDDLADRVSDYLNRKKDEIE